MNEQTIPAGTADWVKRLDREAADRERSGLNLYGLPCVHASGVGSWRAQAAWKAAKNKAQQLEAPLS
jgi:hypothetical protein